MTNPNSCRRRVLTRLCLGLTVLLCLSCLGACSKNKFIPNTKVRDTKMNREVLRVVEKYRKALVARDPARILSLVHPTYQDNSGTPEGADDIDYEALTTLLKTRFKNTTKIRVRIEYQSVSYKGMEAYVDCYMDATFVYNEPTANPRWRRLTDFNRFHLLREKKRWQLVGGL